MLVLPEPSCNIPVSCDGFRVGLFGVADELTLWHSFGRLLSHCSQTAIALIIAKHLYVRVVRLVQCLGSL